MCGVLWEQYLQKYILFQYWESFMNGLVQDSEWICFQYWKYFMMLEWLGFGVGFFM